MGDFELPSNIRQIGGVDEHLRIYVEDYAISYMKQFAELGGGSERIGYLVGKFMVIDGQNYLFISGALLGKFTAVDEGNETFSDESFEYAFECVDKYFESYEIVGWMQSQPGYGTSLNPVNADYHMLNFIKPYHVLMVVDPSEKQECFYSWDKAMNKMNEAKGYFIYYERNRGMQEYMLDNNLTGHKGFKRGSGKTDEGGDEKSAPEKEKIRSPREVAARAIRSVRPRGTPGRKGRESAEYKRLVNMLVSLSAVLFVICFIMGAGLMQSDGRIENLEKDFAALNGAYSHVLGQVSQLAAAQTVFALDVEKISSSSQFDSNATKPTEAPDINFTDYSAPTPVPTLTPDSVPAPTPTPTTSGTPIALPQATIPPSMPPMTMPSSTPKPQTGQEGLGSALLANNGLDEDYGTYIVQRGDTLSKICYQYYGTMDMIEKVMEVNGIIQPDTIFYGKILIMPKLED